jgi:hypothetical protein
MQAKRMNIIIERKQQYICNEFRKVGDKKYKTIKNNHSVYFSLALNRLAYLSLVFDQLFFITQMLSGEFHQIQINE